MPEGTRRVAGRSCRLYRLARPHHQPLARPGGDDHADVCIDGDGLLLSEEWTLDGKIVLVRAAVEVDLSPPDAQLDELLSPVGASPPPPQLDPSIVEQGDPGESFLPAPAPPRGFDPAGVVKLVVPAAAASPDAPRGTILFTAVAWVFVRGPDVVTVEAGEGAPAWSAGDAAVRVQLPGLGPARSVLGPDGAELRMELGGRWVRVRGTVSPDRLLSYAAGLDGP